MIDVRSRTPCLMIQGTGSGVGKSFLTTALCRLFARAGHRVAPFKSQNMSLNAAVTRSGGEIGRAQAAQAEAAGIESTVEMNPILLKPESDQRSQVVVLGRAMGSVDWAEYTRLRPALLPVVAESLERLRRRYELVIIEGAGSPAEINLRDTELVNMAVARLADAPVLLVGDIDRGGVFAALVGTLELLEPEDRRRVRGFIVNRFRGDPALLADGLRELTARTGVPVLGVVPYVADVHIPAEDSLGLDERWRGSGSAPVLDIAVACLPRIANFDDFEPLAREPGVRVRFVRVAAELAGADLVVLPGTKSTIADLVWLRETGLADAIVAAAAQGRPTIGICGGYQMLGESLHDPHGIESPVRTARGLGLVPVTTTFARSKTAVRVEARVLADVGFLGGAGGVILESYEIHAGETVPTRTPPRRPFAIVERAGAAADEREGAIDGAGSVLGTYLHGLFASGGLRRALLVYLAHRKGVPPDTRWGSLPSAGEQYDALASIVARAVDVPAIARLVGLDLARACR